MRTLLLGAALALVPTQLIAELRFREATAEAGLQFVHEAAKTSEKRLPETMGAGVAVLDHDGDGDLDLYFVQGKAVLSPRPGSGRNELWRNLGGWRFERVPDAAGAADEGLGMGVCRGDVDGDGDPDLHVTNLGPDALYLNEKGRFRRAGPEHGIDGTGWSASCTFFDADCDGDLDLHVVRYVQYDPATERWCGDPMKKLRSYCHPRFFEGETDLFYRNDGRGRFTEAGRESGFGEAAGKGLGVIATDADSDGDLDLFVANDSTPNFHWLNDGQGHFREIGLSSGFALSENGRSFAGMGVAAGDADGDGGIDLFVTNLDLQTNTLYLSTRRRNRFHAGGGQSMKRANLGPVGWGTLLWDPDLDGDLDLFVANGHVIDNIELFNKTLQHRQADQLFENLGGATYRLRGADSGIGTQLGVGRGAAAGDLDGDGDLDLVVTHNDGPARLFRNDAPTDRPRLVLELVAAAGQGDPIGARVEVFPAGRRQGRPWNQAEVQGGGSYLSEGARRLHLAAPGPGADVRVLWLSGRSEWWVGIAAGSLARLVEGTSNQ